MEIRKSNVAEASTRLHSRNPRFHLAAIVLLLCWAVSAQAQDEHRFTADVSGGVTPLSGQISDRLDTGWNVGASGGINFNSIFSTSLRVGYNRLGINSALLQQVGTPDGHANIWSVTLDPKLQLGTFGHVRPYAVGGVGYYRRSVVFTRPVIVQDLFFDPFFDVFFRSLVEENLTVRRVTRDGVGGSLGAGFDIRLGDSGVKVFSEARYEYADTGNIPTRMIPVRFGLRW